MDEFAKTINIDRSKIKLIAKGKWILKFYSHIINKNLNSLNILCKQQKINQCQYCRYVDFDENKCMWVKRSKYTEDNIMEQIKTSCIDKEEIGYIENKIIELA